MSIYQQSPVLVLVRFVLLLIGATLIRSYGYKVVIRSTILNEYKKQKNGEFQLHKELMSVLQTWLCLGAS